MSVHESPVKKINIVINDQPVVFHPHLERSPFSFNNYPQKIFFINSADMNKYKIISTPRFMIGPIESLKVLSNFLNFCHFCISLKILSNLKALIIPKFVFDWESKISKQLMRTTKQSKVLKFSEKYSNRPFPNILISISKVKEAVNT